MEEAKFIIHTKKGMSEKVRPYTAINIEVIDKKNNLTIKISKIADKDEVIENLSEVKVFTLNGVCILERKSKDK